MIALITEILYSVITFLIFKKANHFVGLLICVIAFVLSFYNDARFNYFYNEQQKIRSQYDELSMNDYSLNSSPQANMINNTIIHKFDLSKKLYIIRYLDLNTNQELASYPICITQRKIMYDREFLHQIQKDSIFTFTDKVLGKDVQFKIQPLKQDTISYSYYYQVKNGNQRGPSNCC